MNYCYTLITILLFISNVSLAFRFHPSSRMRISRLNETQKFTSFDDMLEKIDKPVLVDFFALWSFYTFKLIQFNSSYFCYY